MHIILIAREKELTDQLIRRRSLNKWKKKMALKDEYKSGIFLLVVLNVLLLVFNYSDITQVWFSYEWDGGFLKDFVHKGTYLLIISLLLSIGIILYYFKGNLNFYTKNKLLKILSYIWLSQNIILVISLVVRNSIYIQNFALAYKRIGVFIFLIATAVGIISIYIKVIYQKSFHYLIRINSIAVYIILVLTTTANWDVIIAKYNVNSYKKSFVEMEYLLELSDKALPYIDLTDKQLDRMTKAQSSLFSFSRSYMSNENYLIYLTKKKEEFLMNYPSRSILEWNYADYKAYHLLVDKED